jgi:molecular chaperone GrpE
MVKVRIPVRVRTPRGSVDLPLDEDAQAPPEQVEAPPVAGSGPGQAREDAPASLDEAAPVSDAALPGDQREEREDVVLRQGHRTPDPVRESQESLLSDMLSVADNLDRALAAAKEDNVLRQGVALTRDELLRVLAKYDVKRLEAHGKPFDPHVHDAVSVVPADQVGVQPGIIVEVMESGYRWEERLLRPARVVVAA